ncbi:FecR family protein [Agriterribacter sp.]|uniref:FecR family protein n=1 Tax=Agriterribacter sp. TaxID=2821509 RepID=UPI002C1DBA85|nr:FecR family protein [Agriterribacter sp.]HRP57972.1 FecR family protein [Agriterribacter sp.]
MQKKRFLYLLKKHLSKTCSPSEKEELSRMMLEISNNELLAGWMEEAWHSFTPAEALTPEEADAHFNTILASSKNNNNEHTIPLRSVRPVNRYWLRIVAIFFVALTGATTWFFINRKPAEATTNNAKDTYVHDVTPGGNYATLTLSDGSKVILDSASNGIVANQGSAKIIKLASGKLKYENADGTRRVIYNTMSTPTGGEYRLMLPDGTEVWLNAASSITYPVAFAGNEREVSITGEVYFEVKKNTAKPFKVKVNEQVIEVLGTHFNINAYNNEEAVKTTLSEGSVKVASGKNFMILQPGQQAQHEKNGQLKLISNPDMEETFAWKDGLFRFNGAGIATIMKQAARWYGVEVVYKDRIDETFVAEIPRHVNLSKLLELLELTKQVHFNIEGKTVTVTR